MNRCAVAAIGLVSSVAVCAGDAATVRLSDLAGDPPNQGIDRQQRSATGEESPRFTLGSGDRLRLSVFGHADLSGEFGVGEQGTVSLPLIGSLRLGGLTISQAERQIVEAFKPDYLLDPQVSIEVLNYRPFYILGEVRNPGSYPYVIGMTVTEAVALGGGFTHRARKEKVVVIRGGDAAKREVELPTTALILPGDVVKVRERFF